MILNVDKKDLHIGISACLVGEKVRFDASNKPVSYTHLTLPTIYSV